MGLGLAAALSVASPAEAVDAVRKGTMRLSAERLALIGARVNDPATFKMYLLPALGTATDLQYPRVAFDYFIIDGLSLGGSAGFGYYSNADAVSFSVLPRVGYAFDLSPIFEFWPRGGIGVMFAEPSASSASAVLTLEGMFLIEMVPHAKFEFGPYLDAAFANGWPIETGAHCGLVIEF